MLAVAATFHVTEAESAQSFAPQRSDSIKIDVPNDPCGSAWSRLPPEYTQDVTIGGATFSPQTLFSLKCNEYKDSLIAKIRDPIERARTQIADAPNQAIAAAQNELSQGFQAWMAEKVRDTLPPDVRAQFDPNSPEGRAKANEWLNNHGQEISDYVSAYINDRAPLIGKAVKVYTDWTSGESRKIIDGMNGILAKARARVNKFLELEREAEAKPDVPWTELLEKHGFSGEWVDNFKAHEGRIRGLNEGYKIKEAVTTIVGAFQTDEPRAKINAMFSLMDTMSQVASESNIPIVSLFGDIVNAYAQVGMQMLGMIDALGERLKERAGYCLGTGVGGGDPRNKDLDAKGLLLCPLALDRKPWSDIYEQVEPTQGPIHFWDGKKFIAGNAGGGGKTGVQETIKLMSAARGIGYPVPEADIATIAKVYNTPFSGGIPGLLAEAREVVSDILARARRLESVVGTSGSCSRETIIAHVEQMSGLDLKAFLDEVRTEGQSRLVTTYAASFVAANGGFGKGGGKRQGAHQRYKDIRDKLKDFRVVFVSGQVRSEKDSSGACPECAGATIDARVSGGEEVRSCEVWKADGSGNFTMHVISTAPSLLISLSAQVQDVTSDTLRLTPSGNSASAKLLVKLDEEEEDDEAACAKARGQLAAANSYIDSGNIPAANRQLDGAEAENCEELEPEIAAARNRIRDAIDTIRKTAAAALSSCDAAAIDTAIAEAKADKSGELATELGQLQAASSAIAAVEAALKAADTAEQAGDLKGARAGLVAAREQVAKLQPPGTCSGLDTKIAERLSDLDKKEQALAKADEALGTCSIKPMQAALGELQGNTAPAAVKKAEELKNAIARVGEASAAYKEAQEHYRNGAVEPALSALGNALVALDALKPAVACQDKRDKIARALDKVNRLAEALAEPENALKACSPAELQAVSTKLAEINHPKLAFIKGRLAAALKAASGYPKAAAAYRAGRIDDSQSQLEQIQQSLAALGASDCAGLRERVNNGLQKIARLKEKAREVEAAIASCSSSRIKTAAKGLSKSSNPFLVALLSKARKAIIDCFADKVEAALRSCDMNRLRSAASQLEGRSEPRLVSLLPRVRKSLQNCARQSAIEKCRTRRGEFAVARNIKPDGSHQCVCKKGYETAKNSNLCVKKKTRSEIMAEGNQQCSDQFGNAYAVKPNADGTFQCRCKKRYEWNSDQTRCVRKPTRAEVMAEGHRQCKNEFGNARAVKPNKDGTFQCRCNKGYRWNSGQTRCVRKPSKAEGNAECRKHFGSAAYSVKANADGTFKCQCKRGYRWNSGQTRCIRRPNGNKECRRNFGKFTYAVRENADGTFQCQCKRGYRWNRNRTRCIRVRRPSISEGHAACKRSFGSRSYATSYAGNGRWNCYTPPAVRRPPPRSNCHHRPGASTQHCGGSENRRPPRIRRQPPRVKPRRPPKKRKPAVCRSHERRTSMVWLNKTDPRCN